MQESTIYCRLVFKTDTVVSEELGPFYTAAVCTLISYHTQSYALANSVPITQTAV